MPDLTSEAVPWTDTEIDDWFRQRCEEAISLSFVNLPDEQQRTDVFDELKRAFVLGIDAASRLTKLQGCCPACYEPEENTHV